MHRRGFKETELFLLHEIVICLDQIARKQILDPETLTYPEFLVLMSSRELSAPTQDEVSGCLNMSKSLVSQRVSALVAKGLINQESIPGNKRKVRLVATEDGVAKLDRVYKSMAVSSDSLFNTLGADRAAFRDTLAGLARILNTELAALCATPPGTTGAGR